MTATAELLSFSPFGPGNSLGSYSATRSASALRAVEREMARSRSNSEYIRRVQRLEVLIEETKKLSRITPNWDSYGAEPPNNAAISAALKFLIFRGGRGVLPLRSLPTAEGGVALSFAAGDKRALVEFLNTGFAEVMLYDKLGNLSPEPTGPWDPETMLSAIHSHLTR